MKIYFVFLLASFFPQIILAQNYRWQQRAAYTMEIDMDVTTHQFTGFQKLVYYNNSPDTLRQVFYHLFFNAFQPGSMMDVRSRTIEDPDVRVRDRIFHLKENEIGYQKINALKQDGKGLNYEVIGTILEVALDHPILPGKSSIFEMEFQAQVPKQIRRSGRDNAEGIAYSMAQWYPKMCEYDYEGWHANPYIGREFHSLWGDFDVQITIDSSYVIGGTGYLQNPQEIGHGYEQPGQKVKRPEGSTLTWHFKAPNVHDFMWAADPDYVHNTAQVPGGPNLHLFYETDTLVQNWQKLPEYTVKAFQYMNEHFGIYPYEQYSVIQGGDGGMEYPMATLITGHRSLVSLVGVTVHELIHSWFQGVLATNESLYAWMDEGFTSYAANRVMHHLFPSDKPIDRQAGTYAAYFALAKSGKEEPLTTHSDHFVTNQAYGTGSYVKGAVFLHQLSYVIGEEAFAQGMKQYFNTWKFKHPNPTDFKRVMEKVSGLELDWYFQYWINTTHQIDYALRSIDGKEGATQVSLSRKGKMPMPLDVWVSYKDGTQELYYIPLRMMRGEKPAESDIKRIVMEDWPWVYPVYDLTIPKPLATIERIEVDPSGRMADIDRSDNYYPETKEVQFEGVPVNKIEEP